MTKSTEILLARMDAHRSELLKEIKDLRQRDLKELKYEVENLRLSRAKIAGMIAVIAPIVSAATSLLVQFFK